MDIKSENRRRLLDSLEVHCLARDIVITLLLTPFFVLVSRDAITKWLMVITLSPFLIFYLVRLINILDKAEHYQFYKTTLTQPHQNLLAKSMYFTVTLTDNHGVSFTKDTHAIFACHGSVGPLLEDYVNRDVTIACNSNTDMVVVIG